MGDIEAMAERISAAEELADLLEASWDAFSLVVSACWACEARADGLFAAFMFAEVAATEARMALVTAPSLPAGRSVQADRAMPVQDDAGAIADAVAGLARVLGERLTAAGAAAGDVGDREACDEAAAGAAQVTRLLSRDGR